MDISANTASTEGNEDKSYSLTDMQDAKEDIRNGLTYSEATKDRNVWRSTLHAHVHNDYPDGQKPKRGPRYKFTTRNELQLVEYTNYCWARNTPKTQTMLKPEIAHFMEVQGIPNTFKHGVPGRGWFENLKKHHSNLRIPSESTANSYRNMVLTEPDWIKERDHLIRTISGDKFLATKQHIFLIEFRTLSHARHPHISFEVLIAYNAKADILLPFLVHKPGLSYDLRNYYRRCFAFLETEDGKANHRCLYYFIQYVERYMQDNSLSYLGIVYLQPELSELFSFATWDCCNQNAIIVCPILTHVFNWLNISNLGLFSKIRSNMIYPMTNDPANKHLLKAFHEVLSRGKLVGHITKTFQRLKLLTVKREKRRKPDILRQLLGGPKHFRKKPYNHQ